MRYFLGGNYVVQFLDKFSTAPALMFVVMMEAIAASWVSLINKTKIFFKKRKSRFMELIILLMIFIQILVLNQIVFFVLLGEFYVQ